MRALVVAGVVAAAVTAAGCDAVDTLSVFVSDHGSVYECSTPDGATLELCTDLDADELGSALGGRCGDTSRLWPRLFGCALICDGEAARGCNAHNGCYCP